MTNDDMGGVTKDDVIFCGPFCFFKGKKIGGTKIFKNFVRGPFFFFRENFAV